MGKWRQLFGKLCQPGKKSDGAVGRNVGLGDFGAGDWRYVKKQ